MILISKIVDSIISFLLHFTYHIAAVVETILIEDETGNEAEEMVITCVATGGRPEASITWTMPETVLFSVEEEVQILVGFDKFNDKLKLKICTSN